MPGLADPASRSRRVPTRTVNAFPTGRASQGHWFDVRQPSFWDRGCSYHPNVDVPVQFFQSTIAIELAVTGALLFQIRYFEPRRSDAEASDLPDPRLRLLVAVILGATVFGSLDAIVHRGGLEVAIAVTVGVALSILPILTRVLPPLVGEAHPDGRRSISAVTAIGLLLYAIAVGALVVILNR